MKRTAIIISLLYLLILVLLSYAAPIVSFLGTKIKIDPFTAYKQSGYWIWLLVMVLSQFALLMIPVKAESKRPVTKRSVILPVLAASAMTGLLALGAFASIGELLLWQSTSDYMWKLGWIECGLVWLLWAFIFFRWSKDTDPRGFIGRMSRVLYRGSLLELLIAVPTHIVVRQRDYCCAGFATFVGISIGIAVMILAFGPAVFFLYAGRVRKKNRSR